MSYRLALRDGTEVESATMADPLEFVVGDGTMIAGLEQVLVGLSPGERAQFQIAAADGFGMPDPQQCHPLPRQQFDAGMALDPGTVLTFSSPSGEQLPATIDRVEGETVWVDFNHPLAGRELLFEVTIHTVGPPL